MSQRIDRKFIVAVSMLLAGLAVLFGVGLRGSLVYYLTVSEFLDPARRTDLGDHFRVNGNVVPGSIVQPASGLGARFMMTDGRSSLPVVYAKETPDTFVDGSEVVVEGSLQPDGSFAATMLLAKCPSKYEAENREPGTYRKPAAPETAVPSPSSR
ncbi:MAG: cytochrome c maturation protein CcmE [Candidatus Polarisedimenticolia bacterium]